MDCSSLVRWDLRPQPDTPSIRRVRDLTRPIDASSHGASSDSSFAELDYKPMQSNELRSSKRIVVSSKRAVLIEARQGWGYVNENSCEASSASWRRSLSPT